VCVSTDEQRTGDSLLSAVLTNCLRDSEDMRLIECPSERRSAMARRAERHALIGVIDVGSELEIRRDERGNVDEILRLCGLTRSGCHARQFATAGSI